MPAVATWTPLQRAKNDALFALATVALAGATRLPVSALRRLGRGLGRIVHALAGRARGTARENVGRALPSLDRAARDALVRECFETLGALLGETVAALGASGPPLLDVPAEARAVLADAQAEGRGVVFPSAHLGPWERVAASLVAAGVPLTTLARESYDPRFTRLYERLRERAGVETIWRAHRGAGAGILRALRAGRVLGMPMDLRTSGVACCDAAFLGQVAPTPVGPARIALRRRAAVVVGTAAPGPECAWIVTATRIPTSDLGRSESDAVELTGRINAELSRRILAYPTAWVWMHERWGALSGPITGLSSRAEDGP